jgi:hypothetical protein
LDIRICSLLTSLKQATTVQKKSSGFQPGVNKHAFKKNQLHAAKNLSGYNPARGGSFWIESCVHIDGSVPKAVSLSRQELLPDPKRESLNIPSQASSTPYGKMLIIPYLMFILFNL